MNAQHCFFYSIYLISTLIKQHQYEIMSNFFPKILLGYITACVARYLEALVKYKEAIIICFYSVLIKSAGLMLEGHLWPNGQSLICPLLSPQIQVLMGARTFLWGGLPADLWYLIGYTQIAGISSSDYQLDITNLTRIVLVKCNNLQTI